MKTLRVSFFSPMLVNLIKKKYNFFYWYTGLDAGCSTKVAIGSFFRSALNSWKYNIRLLCSGNLNGNLNIIWLNEYYMVIWIPTFMLTALPKCWQLGPIMASQHNEDVTKSRHFQFKKSFDFPFLLKWHHKNGTWH